MKIGFALLMRSIRPPQEIQSPEFTSIPKYVVSTFIMGQRILNGWILLWSMKTTVIKLVIKYNK